jgi:hypothetical protein
MQRLAKEYGLIIRRTVRVEGVLDDVRGATGRLHTIEELLLYYGTYRTFGSCRVEYLSEP